jgi:hypothetical protein
MSKKSKAQQEKELQQQICERQFVIMEGPDYDEDFNLALIKYIERKYPDYDCYDLFGDPEVREAFCSNWPEEAFDLAKKWKILNPYDPEGDDQPWPGFEQPTRLIARQEKPISIDEIRNRRIEFTPSHKGEHLLIEINLRNSKNDIKASVERIVNQYWHRVDPPQETKVRGPEYDDLPLVVYYMIEAGKDFKTITYELFPDLNEMNGEKLDKEFSKRYQQIIRAKDKALEFIKRSKKD